MRRINATLIVTLTLVLAVAVSACASSATPTPSPTTAPAKATAVPAAQGAATPVAKPAASPPTAATAAPKPTATAPAAAGVSLSDLVAKAKGLTEYSFDSKITVAGQTMTGKSYVKATKMRQEMTVAGQKTVMIMDLDKKVAYTLLGDQNVAMKLDISKVAEQNESPTDRVAALPNTAKQTGTETIDGKSATVYEVPDTQGAGKYWIWSDRGLPLKYELNTAQGNVVAEFSNYQFGSLADSLFELPAGVQIMDIPAGIPNIPGVPGGYPAPGR